MVETVNPFIEEAREFYVPQTESKSNETNVARGRFGITALKEIVLPRFPNTSISVLEVGPGIEGHGAIYGQYEPYNLTAFIESQQRDYSLSVLDLSRENIDTFLKSRKIFYPLKIGAGYSNDPERDRGFNKAWLKYLEMTNQGEKVVFQQEEDLVFNEYFRAHPKYIKEALNEGYYEAQIPSGLRTKLDNSEVSTIRGDIAVADLNQLSNRPFHFVNMMSVLIYLSENGQKLALDNVSRSMRPGGVLVVDDYEIIMPWMSSLFKKKYHGWLAKRMLSTFNLRIAEKKIHGDSHWIYFLEKTES